MNISQSILPEFEQEMANTRKTLERIPEDKFGWKPHEKSYTLGELASHLANLPNWTAVTINEDSFDVSPPDAEPATTPQGKSRKEILEIFDKNVAEAKAAVAGASDQQFQQPWSLLAGGETIFTLPRIAVLRSFVLSHSIHHRAQLGLYLRLNDVPVPAIYGPTADEEGM